VYVTEPNPDAEPLLRRLFAAGQVDVVLFTASSTVTHFAVEPPPGVRIVCIGPITARSAEQRGWQVEAQPAEYTTDGLVAELLTLYR
jgi:uroporphyrinogen-III synthase